MLSSLRTLALNEKKKSRQPVRCSELSDKNIGEGKRGERQLSVELKYHERSQQVYERDAKRKRQQYKNSLASLKNSRNSSFSRSRDQEPVATATKPNTGEWH